MKALRAKVTACNCAICRENLTSDCLAFNLPLPVDEIIFIPERWANHNCPHIEGGLVLEFSIPIAAVDIESDRIKDGELEVEAPDWWNNLDASKNIGYPVRDDGKYGSYPSHDGFGDESDP